MVNVLNKVSLEMMKGAQEGDVDISQVMCYLEAGKKPTLVQIRNIKAKTMREYLWQFK